MEIRISVDIHYRRVCTDLLDGYYCFDRTRHWSKNRDLNLKYETVLCFAFLILCKAHFMALKILTLSRLSSGTITKKLPTWYYLRGCQKHPCKKISIFPLWCLKFQQLWFTQWCWWLTSSHSNLLRWGGPGGGMASQTTTRSLHHTIIQPTFLHIIHKDILMFRFTET